MKFYKYMFIATLSLAACGMITCTVFVFTAANPAVVLGIVVSLTLAGLSYYHFRIMEAIGCIANTLEGRKTEGVKPKISSALRELNTAVARFSGDSGRQAAALQQQHTDIALQIQLLQRQKQNAEAIIHSICDAVIVTDAFDKVITANSAAETLFGFKLSTAETRDIGELIEEPEFVKLIAHSRQSELAHVRHEVSFARDDDGRIFDCIMSCVKDDKAVVSGIVAVLHDITREKEVAQTKNDFVSHVSHELKTPLASINAYAEMLVDGEAQDAESISRFCSIIQSQAQRLNRLIEDVLNISRIESGLTKINRQPLSPAMLIPDAVKMITSYAKEKNITINAQTPIIFGQVHADKDMISQVIINLLSNAVKYTTEGGSVSIRAEVNEADHIVRVIVSDTGVGIPTEDIDHVFDKFYRVGANKKYAKGTGLGLNLVKQIVEKVHGGRVFVTSKPGQGSTFGFDLPMAVDQEVKTT